MAGKLPNGDQFELQGTLRRTCSLAFLFVTLTSPAPITAQQSTDTKTWRVPTGQLDVGAETILFKQQKHDPIPIKTASLTKVCYDPTSHARGPSAWQATKEMGTSGGGEGLIFAPFVLPVVAGIHATHGTRHFITLRWKSGQPEKYFSLTFEASKSNYLAVLQQLQEVSGKPWKDAAKARRDLYSRIGDELRRIEPDKGGSFYFQIRETARVGNSILDPYFYRAALKEEGPAKGEGNLYLFAGVRKHRELAAVIHVSLKNEKYPVSEAMPVYQDPPDQDASGLRAATEIRTPNGTLAISPSQPYDYDPECPVLPH